MIATAPPFHTQPIVATSAALKTLSDGAFEPYPRYAVSHPLVVWSLQRTLNQLGNELAEDGIFGSGTEAVVKAYQSHRGLGADGIAGQATSRRIGEGWIADAGELYVLPDRLEDGLVETESGWLLGAVNTATSGGTDCGYTQRRVLGPPYDSDELLRAFDSRYQIRLFSRATKQRYDAYFNYTYVASRPDRSEYAWRLATLRHNWPYGADRLASGQALSSQVASWVPADTHFEDGAPVITYADWAQFYAMGSKKHSHRGQVVRYAFGVPTI